MGNSRMENVFHSVYCNYEKVMLLYLSSFSCIENLKYDITRI